MSSASLFVTCAPTLEPLLLEELIELGVTATVGYRGVYVDQWDWSTIYKINYASRLASRVLLPLTRFRCFDQKSLYNNASDIDWMPFMKGISTFAIDANVQHPQLRNSLYAAQIVKDAICDQMRNRTGKRPSIDLQNPDIQLNLFIHDQTAIISFDTSGEPLHKRGYRQEGGEAPIQETLAAAILRIAKYTKESVLLDPCCGSGTILIEAALMATNTPPGYLRKYWGFMRHPDYDQNEWLKVRNSIDEKREPLAGKHIFGVEINKNTVRIAKVNLRAAGFYREVSVVQSDFREFTPEVLPDLIVTNPPHGHRLEDETSLIPLYRALGDFMKQKCAKPSRGYIFTTSMELTKEVGLSAKQRHVLSSGGMDARLLEFELYETEGA